MIEGLIIFGGIAIYLMLTCPDELISIFRKWGGFFRGKRVPGGVVGRVRRYEVVFKKYPTTWTYVDARTKQEAINKAAEKVFGRSHDGGNWPRSWVEGVREVEE